MGAAVGERYTVTDAVFRGVGASPGLALRSFWRQIEAAALAGDRAPIHLLSRRRELKLRRRLAGL